MNTTGNSGGSLLKQYEDARSDLSQQGAQFPRQEPGESEAEYQQRLAEFTASRAAQVAPRR